MRPEPQATRTGGREGRRRPRRGPAEIKSLSRPPQRPVARLVARQRGSGAPLRARQCRIARRQEAVRIDRYAFVTHLEMQVRAGRAPGGAAEPKLAPAQHDVALLHENLRHVGIARRKTIAVIDLDQVAVLRMWAGERDD